MHIKNTEEVGTSIKSGCFCVVGLRLIFSLCIYQPLKKKKLYGCYKLYTNFITRETITLLSYHILLLLLFSTATKSETSIWLQSGLS